MVVFVGSPGSCSPVFLTEAQRDWILLQPTNEGIGGLVETTTAFLGQDPRTTVMLKRIPRKMTSPELLDILTQVPGLENSFDFLHIPWDSARNTSRGFAFVNFNSPLHVGILSDAVDSGALPQELRNAELRYARIQGDAKSLTQLVKGDSARSSDFSSPKSF